MKNYKEIILSNERLKDGNESIAQRALLALINIRLYGLQKL